MAQDMRRHLGAEPGVPHSRLESLPDAAHRCPLRSTIASVDAPQACQRRRWARSGLGSFTGGCRQVRDERLVGALAILRREASANSPGSVDDGPGGVLSDRPVWPVFRGVGACGLGGTRQRSRISAMALSVTKSLLAIRSISSRPLSASRRKLAAVMPPFGKASCAATSSRSGVVGVISSGMRAARGTMLPALAWAAARRSRR